jgi:tetratricopeptide (TPR) repeat protein
LPITRTEEAWLDTVRALVLQRQSGPAQLALNQALAEYPSSTALRRVQAGVFRETGRDEDAETLLRALLAENIDDVASAFTLARLLKDQGRTAAAAAVLRASLATGTHSHDIDLAIQAIELLDDCDRKRDAAEIATTAIARNPTEPRLHAYAGMLEIQLGEFESARRHYLSAMHGDERAWEWHVPIGLSSTQRYRDGMHPDFALFRDGLQRNRLSDLARAELRFALGKAHDDIGDHAAATRHFREGNAIRSRSAKWPRKTWRRAVEARLATPPATQHPSPSGDFTPVFIVGMPRSGTTLLAGLLSRYPRVCNRGELPWIARLSARPGLNGNPERTELQRAAAAYIAQTRQDDAGDARWFIDKQPLNFRYVDLIMAMFPDARIVHCQRNPRDTALSLWMQCFLENIQDYSYDFEDIALVMHDEQRLMAHWCARYPDSIRTIRYEEAVGAPHDTLAALAEWIGLPPSPPDGVETATTLVDSISTASVWQARQPVNTRSVGRWKQYATHLPELMRFPAQ